MYLKNLTLQGFKSFADRTQFLFNDGVSSIVGPNGCGKSNVVDALKWIFGEQKVKDLRGQSMKDVIFAGTDNRKPVSFAEVVVVFDNTQGILPSDYTEIAVTRRLFRSGESEYRINGQKCRLRDIKDTFVDTGIGTESYSILEQGKLDMLLQASPRERRFIFEEAAGISRFRIRRDEALRQLKRTNDNLARLGDIIAEIESRIRSVRIQAGRARKFRELEKALKQGRLQLAWEDLMQIYQERTEWTFRHVLINRDMEKLTARQDAIKADYQSWMEKLSETEAELRCLEAAYESAKTKQQSLVETIRVTEQRIHELGMSQERWTQDARETRENLDQYQKELQHITQALEKAAEETRTIDGENDRLKSQLAETQEALSQAQQQLSFDKATLVEQLEKLTGLRNDNTQVEAERNLAEARLERLKREEGRISKTVHLVASEITKAYDRQAAVSAQSRCLDREKENLDGAIGQEDEKLEKKEQQWAETHARIQTLDSRRDLLERLLNELDGVNEAARKVIQATREQKLTRVRGLMAELVTTDTRYARAVEGALGPWAQAIVVEQEADLDEVRAFLGPDAAFSALVLEKIQQPTQAQAPGTPLPREAFYTTWPNETPPDGNGFLTRNPGAPSQNPEMLNQAHQTQTETQVQAAMMPAFSRAARLDRPLPKAEPSFPCKPAIQLLNFPTELKPALKAILGNTLVVKDDTWESLNRENRNTRDNRPWRIVSESAGILETWGGLRWGTPSGMLVRRSELSECVEELSWLTAAEEELAGEVSHAKTRLCQLRDELSTCLKKRSAINGRRQALEELIKQVTHRRHDLALQQDVIKKESGTLKEELVSLTERNGQIKEAIRDTEARRIDLEQRVMDQEDQVGHCQERQRVCERDIAEIRIRKATQDEKINSLNETRQRLADLTQEKAAHIEEIEKQQAQVQTRMEEVRGELGSRKTELTDLARREEELAGEREEVQVRLDASRSKKEAKEKNLTEVAEQLDARQKDLGDIQLEERELSVKADGIIQSIREEYELDLGAIARGEEANDFLHGLDHNTDTESLRKHVISMKQQLDRHGNVNLAAIDELKELEERFGYLAEQRDDLVKAHHKLNNIINDLNRKSRRLFSETFEQVNQSFGELFRKAFNGGRAELMLEEGEDILTAGIHIMARPPGKKTASVRLLSGGERTLVTLVLLFAVLRTRPTPFCVLDEVDAPLDEANIRRFLVLLDEFTDNTQFLIITHNKLTMSRSDSLIGITMQEKGISKTVSVDLQKDDEDGE